MTEKENHESKVEAPSRSQDTDLNSPQFPIVGIREKLIIIFLLAKIIPLILLAVIAWRALVVLGEVLRDTSVNDSREALTAIAVENIERISTDTAQKVAEFLYQRDADISFLATMCENFDLSNPESMKNLENELFSDFCNQKSGLIRRHGDWVVAEDGMSWKQVDPYIPPKETKKRSVNIENEDRVDGASFRYRTPYGFMDDPQNFFSIPLYDEIALLNTEGQQVAKFVTPDTTKKRHPFPKELVNVSDPANTYVKAERYFKELPELGKDGIYVSDVIGAYTPSRFIGMYTPDYLASRRIDAKIAQLEAEPDETNRELAWKLRVLNAELRNEEDKFNSRLNHNKKVRDEIDRRLGKDKTWKIQDRSVQDTSQELRKLGLTQLAEDILNIPFKPEEEAFAGAENPLGIRFEGIVRWAKPVLDRDGQVKGYVTFAMNHDHLLEMISHITPMPDRYSELSDAFDGNYAFIWDYQCRSIVHPRHHSMCGYNPETGVAETPWLEKSLYDGMLKAGFKREDWQQYIATIENYEPWTGDENSPAFQSRKKKPAPELTAQGLVALDGRYLNNAPQCTGWMDLVKDGGSGSLYILWSGLYKLNTAACIPYYTGQYHPEKRGNACGFGFVAIGAGVDDFSRPANEMGDRLTEMVKDNLHDTSMHLIVTTVILSIVVIFIAIWMASYLSNRLQWLIDGITKFRRGKRNFRFAVNRYDEFGRLAHSFDEMAESIVRSVHSPLVITDMDLNIIYANDQSIEAMGYNDMDDVVGKSYKAKGIYPFGTVYCPITALQKGEESGKVIYEQRTAKYLQGIANYFTDENGRKQGYIITSNDVTDLSLKQIELERAKAQAELASRHKSDFLSRMSHELRTPMNAIIGVNSITQAKIESIPNEKDREELNNDLGQLRKSSLHLLNLLNDILEISNLETGSIELLEKPFELHEMLDEIAERVRLSCEAKNQKLTTQFEDFTPSCFNADGLRLRQVLNNLFNNALKFTPENGQVDFIVQRIDRKDEKSLIRFIVKDTGPGISPEVMEKIFRPFEQIETSAHQSGSGLGLAIVHKILELFQSRIEVHSELGKGSEFMFDVWLNEDDMPDSGIIIEDIKGRFNGQKALVIDDVMINRVVLVALLKDAGFITEEASDGLVGLNKFESSSEFTYDIVFMDIQMPNMNGYESARSIRNLQRADAKKVPIVAVSANAFQEDIEKSLASGMNAHYAKPIKHETLAEILMNYCKPTDAKTKKGGNIQ